MKTDKKALAHQLSVLLASTYSLYLKTQYCHWNVTGPAFHSLHLLFEAQYMELAAAVDLIAERIRALGFPAPGSYREFAALSEVADGSVLTTADAMIAQLIKDNEIVAHVAAAIDPIAEELRDLSSVDLATVRVSAHEKTIWMLRSLSA